MLLLPSLRSKERRRRPVRKSFSGCIQCKTRKIKCDETKPSCERCTDKGLKCPGFPPHPRFRWSAKHEVFGLGRSTVEAITSPTREGSESQNAFRDSSTASPNDDEATRLSPVVQPVKDSAQQRQSPAQEVLAGSVLSERGPNHDTSVDAIEPRGEVNSGHINAEQTSCPPDRGENCGTDTVSQVQDCMAWWSPCVNVEEDEIQALATEAFFNPPAFNDPSGSNLQSDTLDETEEAFTTTSEISLPTQTQLHLQLLHLDTELVEAYFLVVCPIFSTFDSPHNQFRTFVGQKWHSSVPMYYAILSMAAAKLSWQNPSIKVHALEYQSMALKSLYSALSSASASAIVGEPLSTELLFVVLLLGLSACWHEISDLGTIHLRALQHAITAADRLPWSSEDESEYLNFFKEALVYWQMVACLVDDNVPIHDYSVVNPTHRNRLKRKRRRNGTQSFVAGARITPHPWAGVATAPQAIFAHIVRHIRSLRSFDDSAISGSSAALLSRPREFLETLNTLEEELWTLTLPQLHEIANTGDESTPAIHHLLLAEAYMFACLYQLYYIFPNLRRKRIQHILAEDDNRVKGCCCPSGRPSWAQSQTSLWSCLLKEGEEDGGGQDIWLKFLGTSIINRLEQVHITSGTACVHALLLLVGSGSLCVRPELQGSDAERDILRSRHFVLDRISALSSRMLSAPLRCVTQAVSEIFKRLDLGVHVFWMDVLQSMGIVTIIG